MKRRRVLVMLLIAVALAALVYWQYRSWEEFDWTAFLRESRRADPLRIGLAVAIIYLVYLLRAWRWKIFLRPVSRASAWRLLPAMVIGFTGLALLGRPGEFIRPYLVARREGLPVTSQLAVWAVERIFDIGSFALLAALNIFFVPALRTLPFYAQFQRAGFVLIGLVLAMIVGAFAMWRNSEGMANWAERRFARISPALGARVAHRARTFGDGLHTIHDAQSFAQLVVLSLVIWTLLASAYLLVAHAYPEPLASLGFGHVVLLMAFSMVGSLVALPAVGGGTQLMTIAALIHVFRVPYELAVSCGIVFWLVTFMAVTPLGLALARHEHVSLRRLSLESEALAE